MKQRSFWLTLPGRRQTQYHHPLKRRRQPTGCLRLIYFSTHYPSILLEILGDIEVWIHFALSYPNAKKRWKFRKNCDLAKKDDSAAPPRGFCWPAKNQRKSKEGPICLNAIVTMLWIKRFRTPSNVKTLLEYISVWPVPTSQAQRSLKNRNAREALRNGSRVPRPWYITI